MTDKQEQPEPASQSATEPELWLTQELIEKNSRGMSSTELLDFCAEFEKRVRADEREKCANEKVGWAEVFVIEQNEALTRQLLRQRQYHESASKQLADARAEVEDAKSVQEAQERLLRDIEQQLATAKEQHRQVADKIRTVLRHDLHLSIPAHSELCDMLQILTGEESK